MTEAEREKFEALLAHYREVLARLGPPRETTPEAMAALKEDIDAFAELRARANRLMLDDDE